MLALLKRPNCPPGEPWIRVLGRHGSPGVQIALDLAFVRMTERRPSPLAVSPMVMKVRRHHGGDHGHLMMHCCIQGAHEQHELLRRVEA